MVIAAGLDFEPGCLHQDSCVARCTPSTNSQRHMTFFGTGDQLETWNLDAFTREQRTQKTVKIHKASS